VFFLGHRNGFDKLYNMSMGEMQILISIIKRLVTSEPRKK